MRYFLALHFFLISYCFCLGQSTFQVVPLGVKGGTEGDNLSSYMIAPTGSENYVCLDAGTLWTGIQKSIQNGVFSGTPEAVLRQKIRGYLISHAHTDHVSGLILNSIEDTTKNVYGLSTCIGILRDHYFNWESWPNFGSEGNAPAMGKYHYKTMDVQEEYSAENTDLYIRAFALSHGNPYESAAYLIRTYDSYVLYFGDTGPDEVEKTDHIQRIWKEIAPIVKAGKLKGIFLEVSYPNHQADGKLFGHLTPRWLMRTMGDLAAVAGTDAMRDLPVIITHIKPTGDNEAIIKKELEEANSLKLKLIIPEQGVRLSL
jgi:cAMP phosphodiesterase